MKNETLNLPTYVEDAYLQYAMAVVKARALATVQSGLKPVQLRILYAMQQLGLRPPAKAVKSARVVGDVLGKHHPHGDASVYDALVRMAQPFTLRYPLIIGQGNFGSLDGDSAAAMRYTEARLSPISELLLSELPLDTVDWAPNYDGTLTEPKLAPARLPHILLNGSMGIAVGMAADIPSHNLREVAAASVAAIRNPQLTLDEVLQHIQGPDFPGGGQLVSTPEEVKAAYAGGRGSLRCRARWEKEELARGQWQIVVKELPYQVSTRKILEQLDVLTNPMPPAGKKVITQQQANLKAVALDFLEKATDESDKDSGIRLVLAPKNSKVNPDDMMAFLLGNTSLEDSVSLNMNLVNLESNPRTLGLLDILTEWATFRVQVVRRRTEHELGVARKRIHILEGRHTVFLNLDAVVKVIREAEDPKAELMAKFSLSAVQAEDILEMRLRQLNKLEGIKLERELEDLRKDEARLVALLEDETKLRALIVQEIEADAQRYGDDRRTLIQPEARVRQAVQAKTVLEEPLTVVVSKNLWVKAYKGHGLEESTFTFKQGDSLWAKVETSSVRPSAIVDSKGRAYSFDSSVVPAGRGEGAPLSTLIELQDGAAPLALLASDDDSLFLFAGELGNGFLAPFKSLVSRQKAGKAFAKPESTERLLAPVPVPTNLEGHIVMVSSDNKLLAFALREVKMLPSGGKGVALMDAGEHGKVVNSWYCEKPEIELRIKGSQGKLSDLKLAGDTWIRHVSKRGRKGCYLLKKQEILGVK